MKAILLNGKTLSLKERLIPEIQLFADSAIGRDVMPLFVPDLPVRLISRICPAFRIGRLGKVIGNKFAMRYIDAIGAVNVLTPDIDSTDGQLLQHSGIVSVMDSAVITGQWQEWNIGAMRSFRFTVSHTSPQGNDTMLYDDDIELSALDVAAALCGVSSLATVKTGDILIFGQAGVEVPTEINSASVAGIDGQCCLTLRVK